MREFSEFQREQATLRPVVVAGHSHRNIYKPPTFDPQRPKLKAPKPEGRIVSRRQ